MKKKDDSRAACRPFLKQFYRNNRVNFAVSLLAAMAMAGINLYLSQLLQQLLDLAAGTPGTPGLAQLGAGVLAVLLAVAAAGGLQCLFRSRFLARAMGQYKDYAYGELMKKSISAFYGENTSTYISALTNDANSIETNYLANIFTLVEQVILFFGAFALMLWYSPVLTLGAFAMSFLPVLASLAAGKRLAVAEEKISRRNDSFVSTLKDSLSGFSVVKSFQAERELFRLFSKENGQVQEAKRQRMQLDAIISTIGSVAGAGAQLGVFLLGAYLALSGQGVTPGVVMVFVQLMNFVIQPIASLPGLLANRKAARALVAKLAGALTSHVRQEGRAIPKRLEQGIELRDLSFAYEEGGRPVLQHVSVRLQAGKSYALVGASGSGKSTLLNLLMAGHSGYEGQILYDGAELRDVSTESLYELVSLIQQNVFVFNSTIRDNITMFREFPSSQVDRAAALSGLQELIQAKGEGYLCGEGGSGLSGGERQRISIARSLLRRSPVLLVDEATAALDKETAFRVSSSILNLEGLTRIVVTHSLEEALLRRYDGILVLKNGVLEECGRFEELMERKGYFYSLYTVSQ